MLSHGCWQRLFGDPLVVGRAVTLNDVSVTVIGVASPQFGGLTLDDPDVWVPITVHARFVRGSRLLSDLSADGGVRLWGRMRPGATPQRSRTTCDRSRRRCVRGTRETSGSLGVACAIRAAVGASNARLIRQLFTESLLLAFLGSAAALVVGHLVLRIVMMLTGAPSWLDPTPDWRVVVFASGMAFVTALSFGLAPAWQIARRRQHSTLIRQVLIGAQVAASCVLLIVAGLLVRALDRVSSSHPGFEDQQVMSIDPHLGAHGYDSARAAAYLHTLESRLRSLPGVESVARASTPPLGRKKIIARAAVDGRAVDIHVNHITPEFFGTMGIPLLRGRNVLPGERQTMIVSESLGRSLWPGEDPLGKQFDERTVVGIAGSARQLALQDPEAVEAYFPMEVQHLPSMTVRVKTMGSVEDVLPSVASVARTIDPHLFPEPRLLKTSYREKLRETEISAVAVRALGFSALLLACLGLVGWRIRWPSAQRRSESEWRPARAPHTS